MEKLFYLAIGLLLVPGTAKAQTITLERSVIATTGTVSSAFDATAGETVIASLPSGDHTLTQGFHQNYTVEVAAGIQESTQQPVADVYPNPVTDRLWITIRQATPASLQITLTDISGRILYAQKSDKANRITRELDMHRYPAGSYVLSIYNAGGQQLRSVKVVKQ